MLISFWIDSVVRCDIILMMMMITCLICELFAAVYCKLSRVPYRLVYFYYLFIIFLVVWDHFSQFKCFVDGADVSPSQIYFVVIAEVLKRTILISLFKSSVIHERLLSRNSFLIQCLVWCHSEPCFFLCYMTTFKISCYWVILAERTFCLQALRSFYR